MGEMGDLSDFQKWQIMEDCLAGASVTLTIVWSFKKNRLYDYDCVHKAWQDFISKEEK